MDFIEYLAAQGQVVIGAPIPFLVCVLITALGIYWFVGKLYDARLLTVQGERDSERGEVSRLRARLEEFKDKLASNTPDEAKARLDALEAQVAAFKPRRLSNEQRTAMTAILTRAVGAVDVTLDMACGDGRPLAGDIIWAFQNAGWEVQNPSVMGPANPPPQGLGVRIVDPANPTLRQAGILDALRDAGVHFDLQRGGIRGMPGRPEPDAEILISAKLT